MAGLIVVLLLVLLSLAAPLLAPYNPYAQNLADRLRPPSAQHWLGTDELGRDILSRLLYGGRVTLGMVVAGRRPGRRPSGLLVGCVAGYLGGAADRVLMRVTDIFLAFPRLILALAFVAALKPGIASAVIAIALTSWPPYARIARAETLTIRDADFIAAVRLIGASPWRIVFRHIVPLCLLDVIVRVTPRHGRHHPHRRGPGLPRHGRAAAVPEWGAMIANRRATTSSTNGGCRRPPAWRSSSSALPSTCWATGCATCSTRKRH